MPRPPAFVDCAPIIAALREADGYLWPAALRLGMSKDVLRYRIKTHSELRACVAELRREREARTRRETARLVTKNRGNLCAGARDAGMPTSSFHTRVESLGLMPRAVALRPPPPDEADEKRRVLEAIRKHRGQVYLIAEELGMARGTLRARLRKYDLVGEADALRAEHNLYGPRRQLPDGTDFQRRRTELVHLIEVCKWNLSEAIRVLGVSSATFYKNLKLLKIDVHAERRPERVHQTIEALRKHKGVLMRAAASLGLDERTLRRWCVELDIDPHDYR